MGSSGIDNKLWVEILYQVEVFMKSSWVAPDRPRPLDLYYMVDAISASVLLPVASLAGIFIGIIGAGRFPPAPRRNYYVREFIGWGGCSRASYVCDMREAIGAALGP